MSRYTKRRTYRGQQQVYDSNTGTWILLATILLSNDDYQNLPISEDYNSNSSYDSGSYDSGSYDSGSYDSGSYDSGSYDSDGGGFE